MSKKSFTTAPKPRLPTAEEIDAFERNGTGHDRKAVESTEPTKRLSLDLPASTHTRFKTACSATNRKMVAEVYDFIVRRISELEAEAGISRK